MEALSVSDYRNNLAASFDRADEGERSPDTSQELSLRSRECRPGGADTFTEAAAAGERIRREP